MDRLELNCANDYDDRTTAAVKSVLVELGQTLRSFEGRFAVIGGAVPWLFAWPGGDATCRHRRCRPGAARRSAGRRRIRQACRHAPASRLSPSAGAAPLPARPHSPRERWWAEHRCRRRLPDARGRRDREEQSTPRQQLRGPAGRRRRVRTQLLPDGRHRRRHAGRRSQPRIRGGGQHFPRCWP